MNIRDLVYRQIASVVEEQGKTLPKLSDALGILESGVDSLCLAIVIANLDEKLDVRPFEADDVVIPVTFGDLVQVYEHAAAASVSG